MHVFTGVIHRFNNAMRLSTSAMHISCILLPALVPVSLLLVVHLICHAYLSPEDIPLENKASFPPMRVNNSTKHNQQYGGGRVPKISSNSRKGSTRFSAQELQRHLSIHYQDGKMIDLPESSFKGTDSSFSFLEVHVSKPSRVENNHILVCIPLDILLVRLTKSDIQGVLLKLGIPINFSIAHTTKHKMVETILTHISSTSDKQKAFFSEFKPYAPKKRQGHTKGQAEGITPTEIDIQKEIPQDRCAASFPPDPPSKRLIHQIITDYCKGIDQSEMQEEACAVCAELTAVKSAIRLSEDKLELDYLRAYGVHCTAKERASCLQPVQPASDLVIEHESNIICQTCNVFVRKHALPPNALANGLWVGPVPPQLKDLTWAEKIVIARVRTGIFSIKVACGPRKMKANVIAFQQPIPTVYDILPLPLCDLDEVLAVLFVGPCVPSASELEEMKRTPALIRRNIVKNALEWLKNNHRDYKSVEISYRNLNTYPEGDVPVSICVIPKKTDTNKTPESTSVYDKEEEDGSESGPCPYTVSGLMGPHLWTKGYKNLGAIALGHLGRGQKMLALGHASEPESIYHNPSLYPSMFPWLFPYGLGGLENENIEKKISTLRHKRHLLLYHDKRFQLDPFFSIVALNHEQIKNSSKSTFIVTKQSRFSAIAQRINSIDQAVLQDVVQRYKSGQKVMPSTSEEKNLFKLLNDLDAVSGEVDGSLSSKKQMRNEIWSLLAYKGAPSWFITFAPGDTSHPISIYYAKADMSFYPDLKYTDNDKTNKYYYLTKNPTAGARFFHVMVSLFLKHVLGVGTDHDGMYGKTSAYYGTVEQQGRLTLHLHLLLWIEGCLSPQQVRDKIMDSQSDFRKKMVEYLESVHTGDFVTGTKQDVVQMVHSKKNSPGYQEVVKQLPKPPPEWCQEQCGTCKRCVEYSHWETHFKEEFDELLLTCNIHECKRNSCSEKGYCKARFPRQMIQETMVDPESGAIIMKKHEPFVNTVSPILTYLQRCNTDVTSLLSGTAIKACICYISDYISKCSLSTHSIFEAMQNVLSKNLVTISGSDASSHEKCRVVLTKFVNALTSKMDMGAPMCSMYLLGNPDHYTSHKFVKFYWRNYVNYVTKASGIEVEDHSEMYVTIVNSANGLIPTSPVYDYMFRPRKYELMPLYDWVRMSKKQAIRHSRKEKAKAEENEEDEDLDETSTELYETINEMLPLESDQDSASDSDPEDGPKIIAGLKGSTKKKRARASKYTADELFLPDHPQHETHVSVIKNELWDCVPTFMGGSLPRKDSPDHEYYCITMLTLFKPWRTGGDLLIRDTWEQSFVSSEFSDRQQEIMKNFNLRYECLDARDDYTAQRKANERSGRFDIAFNTDEQLLDQLDEQNQYYKNLTEAYDDDTAVERLYESMGNRTEKRLTQMKLIEKAMEKIGWYKGTPNDALHESFKLPESIQPDEITDWKALLKEEQKKRLSVKEKVFKGQTLTVEEIEKLSPLEKAQYFFSHTYVNLVKVVDKSFLSKKYREKLKDVKVVKDNIESHFELNKEQKRAYRIITNHASLPTSENLYMYLGGMAGTGKSRVIASVTEFFKQTNQEHRLVLLAPTGSAAAIIGGSTYHSFLGIREDRNSLTTLGKLAEKMEHIEYILIDEVSMLSCLDLYRISAQLAKIKGVSDIPFGGLNMIFAGDFAQLPPVNSSPLYSPSYKMSSSTPYGQKAAIGKSLWHQVTVVVILRENMRQKGQSVEDSKLRRALENMRYKNCDSEDIFYLRSLTASKDCSGKLVSNRFKNVSIITGLNSHRDKINELGVEQFAQDTGQKLETFYSRDSWPQKRGIKDAGCADLKESLQNLLWSLHPDATSHAPGILKLCRGLPVLIKHNEATECCVTNGAEAKVVSWTSSVNPTNQKPVLKTVFLELQNPPKDIHLPGLPPNVIPLSSESRLVTCTLPDDQKITIRRDIPPILYNFAMTDFCSQGRTRPCNPVDLSACRSHQSYYTCLSRSATHSGTLILQGFNENLITGGLSRNLKQEFQELEILDEITKLRHNDELPDFIAGHRRNSLVKEYIHWKGSKSAPKIVHNAIAWDAKTPFEVDICKDAVEPWKLLENKKQKAISVGHKDVQTFVPVQTDAPVERKRKEPTPDNNEDSNTLKTPKRQRTGYVMNNMLPTPPPTKMKHEPMQDNMNNELAPYFRNKIMQNLHPALKWDPVNYSCSYDSVFTILLNLWLEENRISQYFELRNRIFDTFFDSLIDYRNETIQLEESRTRVRSVLHSINRRKFPWGEQYVEIGELCDVLFQTDQTLGEVFTVCRNCNMQPTRTQSIHSTKFEMLPSIWSSSHALHGFPPDLNQATSGQYISANIFEQTNQTCPSKKCRHKVQRFHKFRQIPNLIVLKVNGTIKIDKTINIYYDGQVRRSYKLRGIVYFGNNHFTCRFIDSTNKVWYSDGMDQTGYCVMEGSLDHMENEELQAPSGKKACVLLYLMS